MNPSLPKCSFSSLFDNSVSTVVRSFGSFSMSFGRSSPGLNFLQIWKIRDQLYGSANAKIRSLLIERSVRAATCNRAVSTTLTKYSRGERTVSFSSYVVDKSVVGYSRGGIILTASNLPVQAALIQPAVDADCFSWLMICSNNQSR